MSDPQTSDFDDAARHCLIDQKKRVKEIIRYEIEEHGKSLEEVKEAIKIGIGKRSDSRKPVENIASKAPAVISFELGSIFPSLKAVVPACYEICNSVYKRIKQIPVKREEQVVKVSLSDTDHAYIDRKYIKYCLGFWLREAADFSNEITENQYRYISMVQEILFSLSNIQDFFQIPEPFRQLKYYKLLMKNYGLIHSNDEKSSLIKFKTHFLEKLTTYSCSIEGELNFFIAFVDFLLTFKSTQEISDELQLQNFCFGYLTFDRFLEGIMNLDVDAHPAELKILQDVAQYLNQEKEPFATEKFKEVISACLREVEVQEKILDGRLVLEASGKSIVISGILPKLETKVGNNSDIEEVRIVGADMLHVDADFKEEVWHGKNIVIFVKKIKIYDKVIWNVSGKNNDRTYGNDAGTGEDGHGKHGADGFPGESGGNVLIQADEVENQENFTIISHGGHGSNGQDGGNGIDGKDGKGITKAEFDRKFPSLVKFWASWSELNSLLMKTVNNIENLAIKKDVNWSADTNQFNYVKTHEGNEVTFSFCTTSFSTRIQAFLLYKGSLGQPGGHGGKYGSGGKGGYSGEIITNYSNIVVDANNGKDGEPGKGGKYGKHGKNGWDMGYTDYQFWPVPQFYGRDQDCKLRLEYHDNCIDRKSVWCPFKDQYATISTLRIEHRREIKYIERQNIRQKNEQRRQTQSTKKKTISQSQMLSDYTHHFSSIGKSNLHSLKSNLENINQLALQAIAESSEQQEKVTTQVNVKRVATRSTRLDKSMCRNETNNKIFSGASRPTTQWRMENVESKKDLLADKRLKLKNAEFNRHQLDQLFSVFEISKQSLLADEGAVSYMENDELQAIEQLLITKYRYAVFQEITTELPPYQTDIVSPKLTPERAARYLNFAEENDNISHRILGRLSQYLLENNSDQLRNIFRFLKKVSKKRTPSDAFKHSIAAFILEVGKSKQIHPDIKKYYDEYKEHSEKQERSLKIFLEPFLSEIERYKYILALWINNDAASKYELMKKIKAKKFLYALWNRVDKQLKLVYNWDKCCNDPGVFKEYKRHIKEKGPLSETYRELLAYIFDINIRLYIEDRDNRFCLLDNHKPGSKQIIHILQRDNKFIQLGIDENFLKLEEERESRNTLFMKIFTQTKSFKQKKEFDDYWRNKIFLSDSSILEDIHYSDEESDIIDIDRKEYFRSSEEAGQMIACLEKIRSEYIGHKGILYHILNRFSNDGIYVSFQELSCLVNSILTSFIEDKKELNIFCWIVAAYPQKNWIDELVLLQLENYFKKPLVEKCKWREYLSKVENKALLLSLKLKLLQHISSIPISIQCIEDILHLLSNIPTEALSLEKLDVPEWPYTLKEKYWTHKLSQLSNWNGSQKLAEASYYLLSIENTFGACLVEEFVEILKKEVDLSPYILTDILSNFHNEKWNLSNEELTELSRCNINEWTKIMFQKFTVNEKERDITKLVELIKGNANTSRGILKKLPAVEKALKNIYKLECRNTDESPSNIIETDSSVGRTLPAECFSDHESSSSEKSQSIEQLHTEIFAEVETVPGVQNSMDNIYKQEDQAKPSSANGLILCREAYDEWLNTYGCDISDRNHCIEQARTELLVIIDRAIEILRGFTLRDTQKLAVLALLANERNTLAQVSTGEGKSLIVVAASIIMVALRREKVDIITSSSVLAKRDAAGNKDIFDLFHINVSHNCNEDIERRRDAYSSSRVVYGDLANFQRDYLLDRFYGKNILGDRNFENVIVDEVDSMLLDKGNNMLYLSHDLPGLDKLESLYIYIWQWVNGPTESHEELFSAFDTEAIKEVVINDLFGSIKKEDIRKLSSELEEQQANIIWERMIEVKIINDQGKMLKESIADNELEIVLPFELSSYKDSLRYLIQEYIRREKSIQVPNYLKFFIEQHLGKWIHSAIMAVAMKEGHDYIMDVDRTGTSPDLNPNVIILDRDTGTDQANSQWDEALHQFLQLKHGCKLSLQSLKAVFISNVSYLKLYSHLYGLTGTLGSKRERELLKEVHKVDFVTIPTARSKQFDMGVPIFCTNKQKWIEEVFAEAMHFINERNRSLLIICETIHDAETLYKDLRRRGTKNVHTYTRDYKEFDIAQGTAELEQGQIIIATNLSGRGTDIKITEGLKKAGGLHVCLTYLPNNSRIEQQAFGRAARSGDKGSGRLIIRGSKGQESRNLKIVDLKKQRDEEELHRISDIKAHYETQIITEEHCFKEFQNQYERLKQDLNDKRVCVEVKNILLQSCLDRWAFWLDRNSKCIKNVTVEQSKRNFENSLIEFISQLKNLKYEGSESCLSWVKEQPIQMIKLGKYFCQSKEYDIAIKLFNEVIALEPCFSEAAHYYKAFALIKRIDWETKPVAVAALSELKTELREAARLFDEHRNFCMSAGGIISSIKQNDEKSIIQIDSYAEQQESRSNLYYMFSQSINVIFGQSVTPISFMNNDISEELSEVIYDDLLRNGVLRKPRLKKNLSEKTINKISFEYGIPMGKLSTLLSTLKGEELDETKFRKTLKEGVQLASREDFWKLLIKENVLTREVKCIIIDVDRLEKVYPTLLKLLRQKISKRKLKEQTLEFSDINGILLHDRERAHAGKTYIILEKNAFKGVINNDKEKYEILKIKGVFSSNKKACIDLNKIPLINFPRYDSITLDDFGKENISRNDAEQILAGLVEQKVLKLENSENGIYRLIVSSNEIEQIKLPLHPVYENAVIAILRLCFIYRITLENIKGQLEAKNFLIYPRLMSKPHDELICELFNQRIIKPFKVSTEINDLEKKLSYDYSRTITRDDLKLLLSRNGLILTEAVTDELCDELVLKEWLFAEMQAPCIDKSSYKVPKYLADIESPCGEIESKYTINDSGKRQPLNFDRYVVTKISQILDDRLQLSAERTIDHIVKSLERSRSLLTTLKIPDSNLQPLTKFITQGEFKHIEEVNIFNLNGLEHLLQLEEKKWQKTMLLNTLVVAGIGICEIAIGVAINIFLLSRGVFLNTVDAAMALVREGVGDIFYAAGAFLSGYFSWKDYAKRKINSLILTGLNFAVDKIKASFSKVTTQVSRSGSRITKLQVPFGKEVAENSRNQIIQTLDSSVGREVGTRIAVQIAINGIAFGLSHAGFDAILKHRLQTLCDRIGVIILCSIGNKVEGYVYLFTILEETYQVLGKDKAIKFLNDCTQSYITDPYIIENLSAIAAPITRSVTQEIAKAIEYMSQTKNSTHISPNEVISTVLAQVPRAEDLVQAGDITRMTVKILNDYVDKIKNRLVEYPLEQHADLNTLDQQQQDSATFQKTIVAEWKSLLLDKAGQVIEQDIVSPIIDKGAEHLTRYHKKLIKTGYRSYRGDRNNERFEELKRQYQELRQTAYASRSYDLTEVEDCTENEYHKNLFKLMDKTRNHKLFADMVRENIPLDVTCLDICIRVIRKMLGIGGLIVIVKKKGGFRRKFSSLVNRVSEHQIIELQLINDHFQVHGSSFIENNGIGEGSNNFLFEALMDQLHLSIDVTREDFRAEIASRIEEDPDVANYIKHNWHKLSTSFPGLSGRHQIKMTIDDSSERWRDIINKKSKFFQDHIADYTSGRSSDSEKRLEELEEIWENEWQNGPAAVAETISADTLHTKRAGAAAKCMIDSVGNYISARNEGLKRRLGKLEENVAGNTNKHLKECHKNLQGEWQREPVTAVVKTETEYNSFHLFQDSTSNYTSGKNQESKKHLENMEGELQRDPITVVETEDDYILVDLFQDRISDYTSDKNEESNHVKKLKDEWQSEPVSASKTVGGGQLLFDYKRVTAAFSGSFAKLVKAMALNGTDTFSSEFSALYEASLFPDKFKLRVRQGKSKRLNGLEFQSRKMAIRENETHREAVRIAEQDIRRLKFNFWDPLAKRQRPSRRSKSLERPFSM